MWLHPPKSVSIYTYLNFIGARHFSKCLIFPLYILWPMTVLQSGSYFIWVEKLVVAQFLLLDDDFEPRQCLLDVVMCCGRQGQESKINCLPPCQTNIEFMDMTLIWQFLDGAQLHHTIIAHTLSKCGCKTCLDRQTVCMHSQATIYASLCQLLGFRVRLSALNKKTTLTITNKTCTLYLDTKLLYDCAKQLIIIWID